jgi:hypothetical protein
MHSSNETQLGRAIFLLEPLSKNLSPSDIDALLNREWAFRAWTFQEMVIASHPIFLCGSRSLSWSCLLNVLSPKEVKPKYTNPWSSKFQIDRSTGSSFQRWQKMAYVWLLFPRPVPPSLAVVQSVVLCDDNMVSPKKSFLERTIRLQLHKQIQRRRQVLIPMALLSILALGALSAWSGTTYVLVNIRVRLGGIAMLTMALMIFWFLFTLSPYSSSNRFVRCLACTDVEPDVVIVGRSGKRANLMRGIHVALRDRVIQRLYDGGPLRLAAFSRYSGCLCRHEHIQNTGHATRCGYIQNKSSCGGSPKAPGC